MSQEKIAVVAVVDGFGAGRFFIGRLKSRGYECIHIQSLQNPTNKNYVLAESHDYLDNFIFNGNLADLINNIQSKYKILNVIPGNELGVELSHKLTQMLNLKRNDDSLVLARRNKYHMVEALKANSIASVSHVKSGNIDVIKEWIIKHRKWPVVVKPLDSASSDNVYICHDMAQVENAFNSILNSKTIFDNYCLEVLVQSYLAGNEYVVNMVSCEGNHFVTEVRMYHKQNINGRHLYDYEELLTFNGELQQQLISYAKSVADAVGIKYGASHTEIMLTTDGPILVEIAARISGATHVDISNEALGYNVVDLTIDSYFEPEKFKESLKNPNEILKIEHIIDIATSKEGYVTQIPSNQKLQSLPSVKNIKWNISLGDYLNPTVSLATSPAKIHMIHESITQIQDDISIIKNLFINDLVCDKNP